MEYLSRFVRAELSHWKQWDRLARAELLLALAGLVAGLAAFAYLAINLLIENEACYGMSAQKLQCQSVDALAAGRFVLVLSNILLPLFCGLLAVRWQLRTPDPSARSVAYWTMFTCVLLVVFGGVLPAVTGSGFFLLPMAVLMASSAAIGFIVWWRARTAAPAYQMLATPGAQGPKQAPMTD
ncbi:MAG: hypothetical protein ABI068_13295 [Ktedonobacterales bacterium]